MSLEVTSWDKPFILISLLSEEAKGEGVFITIFSGERKKCLHFDIKKVKLTFQDLIFEKVTFSFIWSLHDSISFMCAFVIWSDISEGNKVCMQSVNSACFCVLITFALTVQFQWNLHTEGTDLGGSKSPRFPCKLGWNINHTNCSAKCK